MALQVQGTLAPFAALNCCSESVKRSLFARRHLLLGAVVLSSSSRCLAEPDKFAIAQQVGNLIRKAQSEWSKGLDPSNYDRGNNLANAGRIFDMVVAMEPQRNEWLEARGQLRVDSKQFTSAISDFDKVIHRDPLNYKAYSGRALAYEGLSEWKNAVADYTRALEIGRSATGYDDPYILNSRGNALASLGLYREALQDYSGSFEAFLDARQVDGAIYAGSNAALMRVQVGDDVNGLKELLSMARRAPGSIDMRAALAALYWSMGQITHAEDEWQFACEEINSGQLFDGCKQYKDKTWLESIRRWPPVMVQHMDDFLRQKYNVFVMALVS